MVRRRGPLETLVVLELFNQKRVAVTGHTGFKGSWLSHWLVKLGAQVRGLSIGIPTEPSLFESLGLAGMVDDVRLDIRDSGAVYAALEAFKPEFVFHLAAQSVVSKSYGDPLETLSTNIMGTAVVLDALHRLDLPVVAVMITSDKCYENLEQIAGYRETDQLGGKDLYSASKASAENVIYGFHHSFFERDGRVRIASARAGNVVGGGDWTKDRIVADFMRAMAKGEPLVLRHPAATRPWQHVLEPLSGYLTLAAALERRSVAGESFNFGPSTQEHRSVGELIDQLNQKVSQPVEVRVEPSTFKEAGLLQLDCHKARQLLDWEAILSFDELVDFVAQWYVHEQGGDMDMQQFTSSQIDRYMELAAARGRPWAKPS